MLIILSPAKTLDFDRPIPAYTSTQPVLLEQATTLNLALRELSAKRLSKLMDISDKLAELNAQRNQQWHPPFTKTNARQAIFAFRGDVYVGLDADSFSKDDLSFTQQHLRILSGLYGVLRPLDLMQAYRLEMGTALRTAHGKTLYEFWGNTVTELLNKALKAAKTQTLVNLASQEYFGVVRPQVLEGGIITPIFKEERNGQLKIISFSAKKARGLMAAWLIRERITDQARLTQFVEDGYTYNPELSDSKQLVFTR